MSEVHSKLKEMAECGCGCGKYGILRVKTWRNGQRCVRRCECRRCKAPRHKNNATRRENLIAKKTGGSREPLSGALSGIDGKAGLWEWEETSNGALTRGFRRWVESKQVTDKTARLMKRIGARRAFILSWDGKPRWVVIPFDDWANQAAAELDV